MIYRIKITIAESSMRTSGAISKENKCAGTSEQYLSYLYILYIDNNILREVS